MASEELETWDDSTKFSAMSTGAATAESQGDQTSINQNDDDDDEVLIINYTDGFGEEEFPQPVMIKQEMIVQDNNDMEKEGCLDMEGERISSEIKLEFCSSEVKQNVGSFDWSEGPNLDYIDEPEDTEEVDISEFQIEMPMLSPTGENPTSFDDVVSENAMESSMEDLKPLHLIDNQDEDMERSEPEDINVSSPDFCTAELDDCDSLEPKKKQPMEMELGGCDILELSKTQLEGCDSLESNKKLPSKTQLDGRDSAGPKKKPPLKMQIINKARKPNVKKLVCYKCNFRTDNLKKLEQHKLRSCPELGLDDNDAFDTNTEFFKCDTCDFVAKSYAGIVSHVRVHQNNKVRECPYCGIKLVERALAAHVLARHTGGNVPLYKCSGCEFKTNLKREMVFHRSGCEAIAKIERDTKQKAKKKPTPKADKTDPVYKCKWCSYQSFKKNGLTLHKLVHTQQNQKIYKCFSCPFRSTNRILMSHIRAEHQQTNPTLLECSKCDYSSYSACYYQMHLLKGCTPAEDGDPVVINVDHTPEFTLLECNSCSFVTKNSKTLRGHINGCHRFNPQHTYTCPCCPYKATPLLLLNHMKRAHSDSPLNAENAFDRGRYVCAKCETKFTGAWQLQLHISRNKGLDRCLQTREADGADDGFASARQCESCSYSAQNELDLAVHEITFHCDEQPPCCKYCPFKGPKSQVVIHMKEAHDRTDAMRYSLDHVSRSGNGSGMGFERFNPNEQQNQDYEGPLSKKAKTKPHHKNGGQSDESKSKKTFKCEYCGFQTFRKDTLLRHVLTHNPDGRKANKRPPYFRCRNCDYASHFKHLLLKHQWTCKAGKKSSIFQCSCCSYATHFKNNLLKHELTYEHCPPKPSKSFQCDCCEFQSNSKSSFNYHRRKHLIGEIQKFTCEICEFQCGSKKALYAHVMVHGLKDNENERIFACELCGYESRSNSDWYKHIQTQVHKLKQAEKSLHNVAEAVELPKKVQRQSVDVICLSSDESDSDNKLLKQPARNRSRKATNIKIKKEVVLDEDEAESAAEQNDSDLEDLLDYIEISEAKDPRKTSKPTERVVKKSPKVKLKKRKEEIGDSKPVEENVVQKCPSCFFKCNNKGVLWDHFSACHIPSN